MRRAAVVVALAAVCAGAVAVAQDKKQDREAKVRSDKERVTAGAKWIYDDLPRGVEEAKKSGRPLLVVFRCIPCEACAKLDEDVVTRDPLVADLLDKFVCVRVPHANGMDLAQFQFDYDQSWAAFFLNADMTIYGRYGTRSSRTDSADDVSLEGFAKALEGALELHARYPQNQRDLAGKRNSEVAGGRPEELPGLKDRYKASLDWQGKVVPSCIHCHMVNESMRRTERDAGRPIASGLLFPYPNPRVLGLVLDPKERAVVARVLEGSSAERDGFRPGDSILSLSGEPVSLPDFPKLSIPSHPTQPTMSIADVQWVLHNCVSDKDTHLEAMIKRGDRYFRLPLSLPAGWRTKGDISWRASSWDLRRMVTGGMLLEDVSDEDRAKLGIDKTSMALRAKHVGQHGDHAAAKNAGFRKDDVITAIAGKSDRLTESELFARLTSATKPGDKLGVALLREGKKLELTLPMQ